MTLQTSQTFEVHDDRTYVLSCTYLHFADAWMYQVAHDDEPAQRVYQQRLTSELQLNERRAAKVFKLLRKWIEEDIAHDHRGDD